MSPISAAHKCHPAAAFLCSSRSLTLGIEPHMDSHCHFREHFISTDTAEAHKLLGILSIPSPERPFDLLYLLGPVPIALFPSKDLTSQFSFVRLLLFHETLDLMSFLVPFSWHLHCIMLRQPTLKWVIFLIVAVRALLEQKTPLSFDQPYRPLTFTLYIC